MIINIGEKPYDCSICDNTIKLKSDHESHMRTHSDEKSYELTDQMIINIGEKPYDCSVCDNTIKL